MIGVILSGSPYSVHDPEAFKVDLSQFIGKHSSARYLLWCSVHLLFNGGKVEQTGTREYGRANLESIDLNNRLFAGFEKGSQVWMSHGDQVSTLAEGFHSVASSDTCPFAASANDEKKIYTLQFHPEVRNSEYGLDMLRNFVFNIAKAENNWTMKDFVNQQVEEIRAQVGDDKVLLALSGGVDSSVVAALLDKAIGKNLYCMFIDHGLLRKGEAEGVMETFTRNMSLNLIKIDARERFLNSLLVYQILKKSVRLSVVNSSNTFRDEVAKLLQGTDIKWLAQGTLYTDIIESGTKTAQTIKSHHNVGGLPEDMNFKLIEPLNKLFKDEVRALGTELGLPEEMVWRQPFPGPGLGIRVLGEITEEKLEIVRDSDLILREESSNAGLERDYLAVLYMLTKYPLCRCYGRPTYI